MLAERIATATFPPSSDARRLPGIGWLVQTRGRDVLVSGEDLVELARFTLPSEWRAAHWVSSDLRFAAISERDSVLLIERSGRIVWQVTHPPWGEGDSESGCCWISADGTQVWATTPTVDGPDQWMVLDASDGRILGVSQLECFAAGSHPVPHPDGDRVGLSVGDGQDGAEVYWGLWEAGRPVVARIDDRSRNLVDVRPSGGQYLTTPHSSSDGSVAVHGLPGGRVVARLQSSAVLQDGDSFDYGAGYLNERLIIAGTTEMQTHLLAADTLAPVGCVEYPGGLEKYGIVATGRGTWLTSDYPSGLHELWRLVDEA